MAGSQPRSSSPIAALMLAAAKLELDRIDPSLNTLARRAPAQSLLDAAAHHRLSAPLYLMLSESRGLTEELAVPLAQRYRVGAVWQLRLAQELVRLGRVLSDEGIDWVTFKGPTLSEVYYPRPDLRSYADIDVMVRPAQAHQAFQLLLDMGGAPLTGSWDDIKAEGIAQASVQLPGGAVVDLHWHPFSLRRVHESFPFDPDGLIDRRRRTTLSPGEVWTLSHEDTLVHLCAHTCFSGGTHLAWFTDIDRVVRSSNLTDWDLLASRARSARLALIAATMLERARQLLGTPVPNPALDGLAPRYGWRRVMVAAEAVRPLPNTTSGRVTGELLVLSTLESSAASLRQLARKSWFDLLVPLSSDPQHPWRQRAQRTWRARLQPSDESGVLPVSTDAGATSS